MKKVALLAFLLIVISALAIVPSMTHPRSVTLPYKAQGVPAIGKVNNFYVYDATTETYTVSGFVDVDVAQGNAIAYVSGATVSLNGRTTKTNEYGYFAFTNVTKGVYILTVHAKGYKEYQKSIQVPEQTQVYIEITLTPDSSSAQVSSVPLAPYLPWITLAILLLVFVVGVYVVHKRAKQAKTKSSDVKTPEPAQPAPPQSHSDDVTEKLAKLKELRERNLITEEEYQERKREILDNL